MGNNWTVGQRFAALLGVSAAAVLVPVLLYVSQLWNDMRVTSREVDGLPVGRALLQVVQAMQQHRGLSALTLGGKAEAEPGREAKARQVDESIERVAQLVVADGAAALPVGQLLDQARKAWQATRDDVVARGMDGPTSAARHTAAIALWLDTLEASLDHWGLLFDSSVEGYYLIVATLQEVPRSIEYMGQMRARGATLLAAGGTPDPVVRARYAALADALEAQFKRAEVLLARVAALRSGGDQGIQSSVVALRKLGQQGIAYTRTHVVEPAVLSHPAATFVADMTTTIDAMYTQVDQLQQALQGSMLARNAADRRVLLLALAAVTVLSALALGLSLHTGRWIRRQLGAEPAHLSSVAQRVAAGDLATPVPCRAGSESSVMMALERMRQALAAVVGAVRDNASQVAVASGQIAQGNQNLSARTESQASALQQTSASMDELRRTVGVDAEHARQASSLAADASAVASRGGDAVQGLAETMRQIHESSAKIAEIVSTIDGIAFQTNILALNAAVEAARAGEQGRGFAVVAGEVRALAQRSSESAREIRSLIGGSVERVELGSRQGGEAAQTMQEVVQAIRRVSELIGEVSQGSLRQADSIAQVSEAVRQMDAGTQQNAALVEQGAAAAESLRQQAAQLNDAVQVFRTAAA